MPAITTTAWMASAVGFVLLAGGCVAVPTPEKELIPSEDTTFSTDSVDRSRDFAAMVEVEGSGAAPFQWRGPQMIHLIRIGRIGMRTNLLSASIERPQPLTTDPRKRFRWGFDLFGLYADQAGTFRIDGSANEGSRSGILLIWMGVKDGSKAAVYDESEVEFYEIFTMLHQPCTVSIGESETTGMLKCPRVASERGAVASFTVSWKAI